MGAPWWAACALATVLAANVAVARTFVVDRIHPAASDSNLGTDDLPLASIAHAAAQAGPGDTVVVKAGLYREAVPLRSSGTRSAPIRFVADPPGSVVITGADPVTDWEPLPGEPTVYRTRWPHRFVIDHRPDGTPVEHHPYDAPVWGRAEQVIADGIQLGPVGSLGELRAWEPGPVRTGSPIAGPSAPDPADPEGWCGAYYADTDTGTLYLRLADGSDPRDHMVEASTRSELFGVNPWADPAGVSNVEVHGFVFRYAATFPQRAAVWLHGSDNLIENCIIEDMAGSGVAVSGTLRRCVVRRCGQTGGGATGEGFLNEESLWEGNCWKPIDRGWDAGGFKIALSRDGVFRRCIFRRNGGPGLWLDIHVRHVLITECVFDSNELSGLFVEISRDIAILRNLAVNNATNPRTSSWSCGGIQIAESMNCVVGWNTCVGNRDGIAIREQGPRPLDTEDYGTVPYHNSGHLIFANVCALNGLAGGRGYQLGLWYDNGYFGWHPSEVSRFGTEEAYEQHLRTMPENVYDPRLQGLVIDRNIYWPGEVGALALYGVEWRPRHVAYDGLEAFVEATGFDARSIVADPMFANASQGNYGFLGASPALELQAGWLAAPGDLNAWENGFLPHFR